MRRELYNCMQARWLPYVSKEVVEFPTEEELMNVFNFTNYDVIYSLVEDGKIIKRFIIYPFKLCTIKRIKNNQYATLSLIDKVGQIVITRKSIQNKLTIFVSRHNQYQYAPGTLGWIEKKYMEHLLPKSDLLFLD